MIHDAIIQGDALEILKTMPDESIDCVVTSPPYWSLRDYGTDGQLGLEPLFDDYIQKLCSVFDEVRRVLRSTGTCWVNIGDTYYGGGRNKGNKSGNLYKQHTQPGSFVHFEWKNELPEKCLVQIPSRFSIEMIRRGWILRNEIIWQKPNAMPQSVRDRFTVDFEKMFFFTKSKKYFFKMQVEPYIKPLNRWGGAKTKEGETTKGKLFAIKDYPERDRRPNPEGKNKRSVWQISTTPCKEAHFATFPEKLVETPIKAGCPEGGVVLDPFLGSGTTALVAKKLGRKFVGIEIKTDYIQIATNRIGEVSMSLF